MRKRLILGAGSRLLMDDAIGIVLVEHIQLLDKYPSTDYLVGETDVDYCMEKIDDYDSIIIIDAVISGKKTGTVTVLPLYALDKDSDNRISSHGIHLIDILMQRGYASKCLLVGIEPFKLEYSLSLSEELTACYNDILQNVQDQISIYMTTEKGSFWV